MELEKAIKICKTLLTVKHEIYFTLTDKVAIETVLQALEEQEKEIVKYQLYLTEDVIPKEEVKNKIEDFKCKLTWGYNDWKYDEKIYQAEHKIVDDIEKKLLEEKQYKKGDIKMNYYTKRNLQELILDCDEGHNLVNYILKLQDLLEEK